jgi:hypothetical protein
MRTPIASANALLPIGGTVALESLPPYVLALFDVANFPAVLQPMIQQGYLETEFDDFLEATNGYWINAQMDQFTERFDRHRGTTITRTRPGLKAPVQVPVDNVAAQTPPTNGIVASTFQVEQYTFSPFELTDGDNIDLIGTNFAIVNRFEHMVKVNVHQGMQSVDLLARDTYTAGYAIGQTYATANGSGTGVNQTVHVDDIRGLSTAIQNGQVLAVSPANLLPVMVYPLGVKANAYGPIYCNGAAPDALNVSSMAFVGAGAPLAPANTRGNGQSGVLTFANLATAINATDILVAGDAPFQLVGGNGYGLQAAAAIKSNYSQLAATDATLTSAMLLQAKAYLRNNAVPFAIGRSGEAEGTFCLHCSENVMLSLYNDADFKQANQTLGQSKIYLDGKVSQYLGVTFLPNTNAPKIPLATGGYAYLSILTGHGAIQDEWYEGLEDWASSDMNPASISIENGIAQILMPAYSDTQGRRAWLSWLTIRDMVCPTDVTRSSVVLTGSGSRRARAVAIWTFSNV